MSKTKKILLITEGAKGEKQLLEKLLKEYNLAIEYELYTYGTNIYELYERMFTNQEENLENLDLLQTLKERDSNNEILNQDYTDILLIFDYEPQDNRFSSERIKKLLEYFCESTDNGKLYINYPMLEAYKHFRNYPDETYKDRMIDLETVKQGLYKKLVGQEAKITNIRKFTREVFNCIIKQNIEKENYILNQERDIRNLQEIYLGIDNMQILNKQNELLKQSRNIYVLSTCLFFICDYNFQFIT